MSRKYTAPLGASSITIDGETFEVKKGIVTVGEEVSHADLISHGYFLEGDEPAAPAGDADLDARKTEIEAVAAELKVIEADLVARSAALDEREAALAARDVDLAMREHAVAQREAAPAGDVPPPPPPAGDVPPAPAKRGGK